MPFFYHYTDKKGAEGIWASKIIKQSTGQKRDAYHGDGVYLTKMPPQHHSKVDIAMNNWTTGSLEKAEKLVCKGRVDYVVEV
jgi:hypothetical protein